MPLFRRVCGPSRVLFVALGALCLSACQVPNPAYDGVSTPSGSGGDTGGGGRNADAATPDDVMVAPDAAAPDLSSGIIRDAALAPDATKDGPSSNVALPGCDRNSADLALCMRFENTLVDESSFAHAVAGQAAFIQGLQGFALNNPTSSMIQSPESAAFVAPSFTLEAWVRLNAYPTGGDQLLLRLPGVVSLSVTPSRKFICRLADDQLTDVVSDQQTHGIAPAQWVSVACVRFGGLLDFYVNGKSSGGRGVQVSTSPPMTSHVHLGGGAAGARFDGLLDNVRFWRRRLLPDELCAAAPECAMSAATPSR